MTSIVISNGWMMVAVWLLLAGLVMTHLLVWFVAESLIEWGVRIAHNEEKRLGRK